MSTEQLSAQERHELTEISHRVRSGLQQAAMALIEIGGHLRRAKEMLAHGEFMDWVQDQCGISHRTATAFMLVDERFGDRLNQARGLPSGVLIELASPSVPDELVEQVLARQVEPTVRAIRAAMDAKRTCQGGERAARDLVQNLWALPNGVQDAARVLSHQVLADATEENNFDSWAAAMLRAAADLIEDGAS